MKTRCPHCQSIMTIPKGYAVFEVKCEQCQQKFTPKEYKTRQHANWGVRIGIGVVLFLGVLLIISALASLVTSGSKSNKAQSEIARLREQNRMLEAKVHRLKQEDSQKGIKQVTLAEQSKSPRKLTRKVEHFEIIERKMLNDALILSVATRTSQRKDIAEYLIKQNPGYYMVRVFFYDPGQTAGTDIPKCRYEWTETGGLTKTY